MNNNKIRVIAQLLIAADSLRFFLRMFSSFASHIIEFHRKPMQLRPVIYVHFTLAIPAIPIILLMDILPIIKIPQEIIVALRQHSVCTSIQQTVNSDSTMCILKFRRSLSLPQTRSTHRTE